MGAISITRDNGGIPGYMPWAPAFDHYEVVYAEKMLYYGFFTYLGKGWHQSKQIPATFFAPGWRSGYTDKDATDTPLMARGHR